MKKSVQVKTAKKIGLVYAISILIGTVVGVGIFLKNINVFHQNGYNATGILVAWGLASIISLCAAWSFGEVGSCSADHGGLASWITKLYNKKFGKFVSLVQPFFYYSIIASAISIFAAETFFQAIPGTQDIHVGAVICLGVFLFLFFLTLNFISLNASKKLQFVLSSLKIVPILIVLVVGFMTLALDPNKSLFNENAMVGGNEPLPFNFASVIISLPAILFAFDSFIGVGNLSLDMDKPKKNVPLTIIIGMSMVVVVYLLITIALMCAGTGNALDMFGSLDVKVQNALQITISVFMFISIIGVLNGFSPILIRSLASVVEKNYLFNSSKFNNFINNKLIKNKNLELKSGYVLAILCFVVFIIAIGLPSMIMNTDAYIDGFSNFPTTIFFGIYGLAILGGIINRKTNKVQVNKITGFYITAPIAVIGCFFVLLFQTFYTFSFRNINEANTNANWGLFYKGTTEVTVWQASIFYFAYLAIIGIFYGINELLKKKFESDSENVDENSHISLDPLFLDIDEENEPQMNEFALSFHVLQHELNASINKRYLSNGGSYD